MLTAEEIRSKMPSIDELFQKRWNSASYDIEQLIIESIKKFESYVYYTIGPEYESIIDKYIDYVIDKLESLGYNAAYHPHIKSIKITWNKE